MITAKQFHDIVGHYTRMDVVSMNLCTNEDRPLCYNKKAEARVNESDITFDLLKDVLQGQREIVKELRRLVTLSSEKLSGDK
jgi:hypothetical protein